MKYYLKVKYLIINNDNIILDSDTLEITSKNEDKLECLSKCLYSNICYNISDLCENIYPTKETNTNTKIKNRIIMKIIIRNTLTITANNKITPKTTDTSIVMDGEIHFKVVKQLINSLHTLNANTIKNEKGGNNYEQHCQ